MQKLPKNFQRHFWNIQHAQNIFKITPNERGDQTHLLRIYFFVFLKMPPPHFVAIFALFKLQKALIFGIFILEMSPKWLLNAFNLYFIYFD